jgi:predicted transglutaminase-like cysteine proteinase
VHARARRCLLVIAAASGVATPALATDHYLHRNWSSSDALQTAVTPPGFVTLCMHRPELCSRSTNPDRRVADDERTEQLLNLINERLNREITYESDPAHYGVVNRWAPDEPADKGDCKDYALAKRQALLAAGFPGSALRIAIARIPDGELHAVLTVTTDRGILVLDNLSSNVTWIDEMPYRWIEWQSPDDPLRWLPMSDSRN